MTKTTKRQLIKYALYFVVLVILFSLQTTPKLFEIQNVKPVLVIPFVLAISMFENEVVAFVFCGLGGMFWDYSSNCVFGFNTIIFMAIGVLISLLVKNYVRTKLLNYLAFLSVSMLLQGALYYFFYYVLWEIENSQIILVNYILPTILYTVVVGIGVFFVSKILVKAFSETVRM